LLPGRIPFTIGIMGKKAIHGTGPFFTRLGEILEELNPAELRERITEYARGLDDASRKTLLAALSTPPRPPQGSRTETKGHGRQGKAPRPSRDPILKDIEAFAQRARSHEFMEGWGWDPEIGDERAWGDESWTWELGDLFDEAEQVFLSGDLPLAVEAFESLIGLLLEDMEESLFPGAGAAEEMVEADLGRARACYLRALYETTPPTERLQRLLGAMGAMRWIGGDPVGIAATADADALPLPDFEAFMTAWVEQLEAAVEGIGAEEPSGWNSTLRWLQREAALLTGGVEGLGALARRSKGRHPEAFQEWVDGLLQAGRAEEALSAAMEGAEVLVDPGEGARMADGAGMIARHLGKGRQELEACRIAWRLAPTGGRLRTLLRAEEEEGEGRKRAVAREFDAFGESTEQPATRPGAPEPDPAGSPYPRDSAPPPRVMAALEILNGRLDQTLRRLQAAAPVGWSRYGHPGPLAFPCLLAAASGALGVSGAKKLPSGSVLREMLDATDAGMERSAWESGDLGWKPDLPAKGQGEDLPRFPDLLREALGGHPPEAAARAEYLEEGERTARERIRTILSRKHRAAYERAATAAAAASEAWILAGEADRGEALLAGIRKEYARYSAFTRELRSVTARSPLLHSSLGPRA
jgi:hypothetical protein